LESGESLSDLIAAAELSPADVIAALAHSALGDDDSLGPGLVREKPRHPRLERALSEPAWAPTFPTAGGQNLQALAAGLLLVHDFWDASHDAAQEADNLGERHFSAYWHGIAHRREPDAGNAGYWFRRVGRHPVFPLLAEAARPLLAEHDDSRVASRLISDGAWSSVAMIDLCTQAHPGTASERLARRLQRIEMWLLLEATYAALTAT
jgi:hypothetical protein